MTCLSKPAIGAAMVDVASTERKRIDRMVMEHLMIE
jgi:hypothetical protein